MSQDHSSFVTTQPAAAASALDTPTSDDKADHAASSTLV
jgi:hypothetical protein